MKLELLNKIYTKKDIERKVELATILGTWQATLTDFKYLRKIWKDNTEEESTTRHQ